MKNTETGWWKRIIKRKGGGGFSHIASGGGNGTEIWFVGLEDKTGGEPKVSARKGENVCATGAGVPTGEEVKTGRPSRMGGKKKVFQEMGREERSGGKAQAGCNKTGLTKKQRLSKINIRSRRCDSFPRGKNRGRKGGRNQKTVRPKEKNALRSRREGHPQKKGVRNWKRHQGKKKGGVGGAAFIGGGKKGGAETGFGRRRTKTADQREYRDLRCVKTTKTQGGVGGGLALCPGRKRLGQCKHARAGKK